MLRVGKTEPASSLSTDLARKLAESGHVTLVFPSTLRAYVRSGPDKIQSACTHMREDKLEQIRCGVTLARHVF
jgi:hypothetical protein